jgi:hypothetical protein
MKTGAPKEIYEDGRNGALPHEVILQLSKLGLVLM